MVGTLRLLGTRTLATIGVAALATVFSGVLNYAFGPSILSFAVSTVGPFVLAIRKPTD